MLWFVCHMRYEKIYKIVDKFPNNMTRMELVKPHCGTLKTSRDVYLEMLRCK